MKSLTSVAVLLLVTTPLKAGEPIEPRVGDEFGKVMSLEIEFVDKARTYFDQNIRKEQWAARVLAVDGKKLDKPITMTYLAGDERFEKNRRYQLLGYEDVYGFGAPQGWHPGAAQFNYNIHHQLILKRPKQARKTKSGSP